METIPNCGECDSRRFAARGALWCPRCDKQTEATINARKDVEKK